jgi:hypothetical protein
MELRKNHQKPLEFKYEDVTFLVKPRASEEDRMLVMLLGEQLPDGNVKFSRPDFCRLVVERMVVGWEGVTRDGKPMPYSFTALSEFPRIEGKNVYLEVGAFILQQTDIQKSEAELKNA